MSKNKWNIKQSESGNAKNEYLQIVTTVANNGVNYNDGISMILYLHSLKNEKIVTIPVHPLYPVAFADFKENKVYYANITKSDGYDNLFEYDLETTKSK